MIFQEVYYDRNGYIVTLDDAQRFNVSGTSVFYVPMPDHNGQYDSNRFRRMSAMNALREGQVYTVTLFDFNALGRPNIIVIYDVIPNGEAPPSSGGGGNGFFAIITAVSPPNEIGITVGRVVDVQEADDE